MAEASALFLLSNYIETEWKESDTRHDDESVDDFGLPDTLPVARRIEAPGLWRQQSRLQATSRGSGGAAYAPLAPLRDYELRPAREVHRHFASSRFRASLHHREPSAARGEQGNAACQSPRGPDAESIPPSSRPFSQPQVGDLSFRPGHLSPLLGPPKSARRAWQGPLRDANTSQWGPGGSQPPTSTTTTTASLHDSLMRTAFASEAAGSPRPLSPQPQPSSLSPVMSAFLLEQMWAAGAGGSHPGGRLQGARHQQQQPPLTAAAAAGPAVAPASARRLRRSCTVPAVDGRGSTGTGDGGSSGDGGHNGGSSGGGDGAPSLIVPVLSAAMLSRISSRSGGSAGGPAGPRHEPLRPQLSRLQWMSAAGDPNAPAVASATAAATGDPPGSGGAHSPLLPGQQPPWQPSSEPQPVTQEQTEEALFGSQHESLSFLSSCCCYRRPQPPRRQGEQQSISQVAGLGSSIVPRFPSVTTAAAAAAAHAVPGAVIAAGYHTHMEATVPAGPASAALEEVAARNGSRSSVGCFECMPWKKQLRQRRRVEGANVEGKVQGDPRVTGRAGRWRRCCWWPWKQQQDGDDAALHEGVTQLGFWDLLDKFVPVFQPSSSTRASWDALLLLLLLYTAVVVPLEVGFRAVVSPGLEASHLAVLAVFWADIAVQFRTAYVDSSGEVVRDGRSLAAHYSRTWLALDVLSSLPWAELMQAVLHRWGSREGVMAALARLPRLLRLVRLTRQLERSRFANLFRIAQLLAVLLLAGHWTACAWHGLSEWLDDWPWLFTELSGATHGPLLQQYSSAVYYAYVVVVGNDNAQISPQNDVERIFVIVALLLGSVLSAIVVSNMALLVANSNSLSNRYQARAALAADALRYVGAPEAHRARVAEYFHFLARNDHPGPEADAVLSELPRGLVEDIKWRLYSAPLHRLPLFAGCDEPFMAALQARLTLTAFTGGEVMFEANDVGRDMLIVRRGSVLLKSTNGNVTALLQSGDSFGELALLPDISARKRTCTAVALQPTDVIVLSSRDLAAVCRDHPEAGALVQERLMQQHQQVLLGGVSGGGGGATSASWYWSYEDAAGLSYSNAMSEDEGYDFEVWFNGSGRELAPPPPLPPADAKAEITGGADATAADAGGVALPLAATPSMDAVAATVAKAGGAGGVLNGDGGGGAEPADGNPLSDPGGAARVMGSDSGDGGGAAAASGGSSASSWESFLQAAGAAASLTPPRIPPRVAAGCAAQPRSRFRAGASGTLSSQVTATDGIADAIASSGYTIPSPPVSEGARLPPRRATSRVYSTAASFTTAVDGTDGAERLGCSRADGGGLGISAPPLPAPPPPPLAPPPAPPPPLPRPPSLQQRTASVSAVARIGTEVLRLPAAMPPPPSLPMQQKPQPQAQLTSSFFLRPRAPALPHLASSIGSPLNTMDLLEASLLTASPMSTAPSGTSAATEGGVSGSSAPSSTAAATEVGGRLVSPPQPSRLRGPAGAVDHSFVLTPPHLPGQLLTSSGSHASTPTAGASTAIRFATPSSLLPPPVAPSTMTSALALTGPEATPEAAAATATNAASAAAAVAAASASSGGSGGGRPAELPDRLTSLRGIFRLASKLIRGDGSRGGGDGGGGADGGSPAAADRDSNHPAAAADSTAAAGEGPPRRGFLRRYASGVAGRAPVVVATPAPPRPLSSSETPLPFEWLAPPRPSSPLPGDTLLAVSASVSPLSTAPAWLIARASREPAATQRSLRLRSISGLPPPPPPPEDPVARALQTLARLLEVDTGGFDHAAAASAMGADAGASQLQPQQHQHLAHYQHHPLHYYPQQQHQQHWGAPTQAHSSQPQGPPPQPHLAKGHFLALPPAAELGGSNGSWPTFPSSHQHQIPQLPVSQQQQQPHHSQHSQHHHHQQQHVTLDQMPPAQLAMLMSLADAVVRRFGVDSLPSVQEAVQARVRQVEQRLAAVLQSSMSSLKQIEQTVAAIDDAAAVAKRRLASLEHVALEAAADGVLAPRLLSLLDTESGGITAALERLHQAAASGSSAWSDTALLSSLMIAGLHSQPGQPPPGQPPPPSAHPSLLRPRSLRSHGSAVSDAAAEGVAPSRGMTGGSRGPSSTGSNAVAPNNNRSSSNSCNGANTNNTNSNQSNPGELRSNSSGLSNQRRKPAVVRRRTLDPNQMKELARNGSGGLKAAELPQDSESAATTSASAVAAAAAAGDFQRCASESRRRSLTMPHRLQSRTSIEAGAPNSPMAVARTSPTAPAVTAAAALATTPGVPVTAASPPAGECQPAAALSEPSGMAQPSPAQQQATPSHVSRIREPHGAGSGGSGTAVTAGSRPGYPFAHYQANMPVSGVPSAHWPGGGGRNAVLDDSIVRDGGGGGGRTPVPTLLPSERPGARRAPGAAPTSRGGAAEAQQESSSVSSVAVGGSGPNGGSRRLPFRRASASVLVPQHTASFMVAAAAGAGPAAAAAAAAGSGLPHTQSSASRTAAARGLGAASMGASAAAAAAAGLGSGSATRMGLSGSISGIAGSCSGAQEAPVGSRTGVAVAGVQQSPSGISLGTSDGLEASSGNCSGVLREEASGPGQRGR